METFEARLESYGTAKSGVKKRASTSKAHNGPQWPHTDPTPDQLAQAGFYYDPNEISADRVTCTLCQTVLDGWESNDDPVKEHINYSPNCGVAIHAKIEQDVEAGLPLQDDPSSEEMVQARKATFRDMWPHERKRGWACKTQKMAEAGWYYCPTSESDDFVKCAYCGLSLDGWEPKDKPLDEHQRRSENCTFFSFQLSKKGKGGRTKKSRVSKAARLSTQSTATTLEDTAMIDASMDEGDTVMTTATDVTQASTTSKAKKPGRQKKTKAKSKTSAAPVNEDVPVTSILEPEDDDFEVKVEEKPTGKSTRGRKRKSDEGQTEPDEAAELPPPKRRGAPKRSSTVTPGDATEPQNELAADLAIPEVEEAPAKSGLGKGKRATRSRVTSTTRKASAASNASTTTPQMDDPADAELDAALGVDLNQALSDEQSTKPAKTVPKPRTVSRSQNKKATVPTVAAHEAANESISSMETMTTALETPPSTVNADESIVSVAPINIPKQRVTKKGKTQIDAANTDANETAVDVQEQATIALPDEKTSMTSSEPARPRGKGRPPSRKASRQVSRQKNKPVEKEPEPQATLVPVDLVPEALVEELTVIHEPTAHDSMEDEKENANQGKTVTTTVQKKGRKAKTSTAEEAATKVDTQIEPKHEPSDSISTQPQAEVASNDNVPKAKATRGRPRLMKTKAPAPEPEPVPEIDHPAQEPPPIDAEPTAKTGTTPREIAKAITPVKAKPSPAQQVPSPTPSPQSSDAENHPPSSRPSAVRPPLIPGSPVIVRVPLAASTPTAPRTNLNPSKLSTTFPWTSVDLDYVLAGTPGPNKENLELSRKVATSLTSPEKQMTVEEWVRYQAAAGQERLREECERVVQRFENEGVRALKALEGVVVEE